MKVTMLLADAAQAVSGKLYILGGGWSLLPPTPTPMALAIKIEVPWTETNVKHSCRIELVDSDGDPVMVVASPMGDEEPIVIETTFEVGRPPGTKHGTPLDFPLAINFGPLPLEAGQRYEWRLTIDDHIEEDWRVAFSTMVAAPQQ